MKPKAFLDTNILISGIFFSGLESKLLALGDLEFVTADICKEEILEVTKRKYKSFGIKTLDIAVREVENSFADIEILPERKYKNRIDEAKIMLPNKINDQKILAAVLTSNPDYFVTGDKDFDSEGIKKGVNIVTTRNLLKELGVI